MEQRSSWVANRFSASQEIPCILWNPKAYYLIYKCALPVPILYHINPVHASPSTFWRSIFILSVIPGSLAKNQGLYENNNNVRFLAKHQGLYEFNHALNFPNNDCSNLVWNFGNFLTNYLTSQPRRRKFADSTARTPNLTALIYPLITETCILEGSDKPLARPSSRCRRTESIVPLERGACSSAEL